MASSSSRIVVHETLTSVLTARSKVAPHLVIKPNDQVVDIDAADRGNQLAVTDYVDDMYKFYKISEELSHPDDYMSSQVEINDKWRAIVVDWLIQLHQDFKLMPEALYLTVNIMDRYLSMVIVSRRELQLLGMSAMLIASKYEQRAFSRMVGYLSYASNGAYSPEEILVMEKVILNKLRWYLTVPTPYIFLLRFIKAAVSDQKMEHMAYFFAEMDLVNYSMAIQCPSMAAAAAVYAARCTLRKSPLWTETLKSYTGYSEGELLDNASVLVSIHSEAPENELRAVYKKYSSSQFGAVALLPPAINELRAVYKKYSSSQFGAVALLPPAIELMEQLKAAAVRLTGQDDRGQGSKDHTRPKRTLRRPAWWKAYETHHVKNKKEMKKIAERNYRGPRNQSRVVHCIYC